jgi:NAD(P)-dependent dehydrogenase (short-subunit alcohol dehydrogenase family)
VSDSVRKQTDADRLQRESDDMFVPLLFDVVDETAVQLAAEKVDQGLNSARLAGLVNNAGIDCFMAISQ